MLPKCKVSISKRRRSMASLGVVPSRKSSLSSLYVYNLAIRDLTRTVMSPSSSYTRLSRRVLLKQQLMTKTHRLIYFAWWWKAWKGWSRSCIWSKPCSRSPTISSLRKGWLKLRTISSLSRRRLEWTPGPKLIKNTQTSLSEPNPFQAMQMPMQLKFSSLSLSLRNDLTKKAA